MERTGGDHGNVAGLQAVDALSDENGAFPLQDIIQFVKAVKALLRFFPEPGMRSPRDHKVFKCFCLLHHKCSFAGVLRKE